MDNHYTILMSAIITCTLKLCNCYFIPGGLLFINDARTFCQDICDSELASIHSSTDMQDAIATINSRQKDIWGGSQRGYNAYIGLRSPSFPNIPFTWNDSTIWDYGITTDPQGIYPWKMGNPQGQSPACVYLGASNPDGWNDVQCDYADGTNHEEDRFLCNSCNGVINKYAMFNMNGKKHDSADTACGTMYGTTLASIHTTRDNNEVIELWRVNHENNLWIGLEHGENETDPNTYFWDDGSNFDYGRNVTCTDDCSPWSGSGPDDDNNDEKCVAMKGFIGKWDDKPCESQYNFVCNLPSELSQTLNTWTTLFGGWSYDSDTIDLSQQIDAGSAAEIVVLDKNWYNGNSNLLIDYTFKITFVDNVGSSGVKIYNGASGKICEYYYVSIRKYTPSGGYFMGVSRGMGDIEQLLEEVELQIDFNATTYYTMEIIINKNGKDFTFRFNDKLYFSYSDSSGYNTLNNGFSGYIGVWADQRLATTAKNLYLSGTIKTVTQLDTNGNICLTVPTASTSSTTTEDPTPSPTDHPTPSPTNQPTEQPTPSPTDDPTPAPTDDPTENPTPSPTDDPTPSPTNQPTEQPTHVPTNTPTHVPTDNPTEDPTPAPTDNPSDVPTSAPSNSPTLSPFGLSDPTATPTSVSDTPTENTLIPTVFTVTPTSLPSSDPSISPTDNPSISPTKYPYISPTKYPSMTDTTYFRETDIENTNDSKAGLNDNTSDENYILYIIFGIVGGSIIGFCCYLWVSRIKRNIKRNHNVEIQHINDASNRNNILNQLRMGAVASVSSTDPIPGSPLQGSPIQGSPIVSRPILANCKISSLDLHPHVIDSVEGADNSNVNSKLTTTIDNNTTILRSHVTPGNDDEIVKCVDGIETINVGMNAQQLDPNDDEIVDDGIETINIEMGQVTANGDENNKETLGNEYHNPNIGDDEFII